MVGIDRERWRALERWLDQALELNDDERVPWLEAMLADDGTTATAISANGTTIGTADLFTTTRYWTMNGLTAPLQGPQYSSPDDIAYGGRLVGYTYKYSPINPHRPWTVINLRVNGCGSIVGQQEFDHGVIGGVLWTKFQCDVLPPLP